jgi:predicted nucleotidyltransferase
MRTMRGDVPQNAVTGNRAAMPDPDADFQNLLDTMKNAAAVLRDAGVPFALAGGLACWARGGPQTEHDVDFVLKPEDAQRAQHALGEAAFRMETPPEPWLLKAFDGDVLVDLIFDPQGGPVDDALLERADELEVSAMPLRVAALEDVMAQKLLALTEQEPDYTSVLEIARALREQIDWDDVRARTESSAFAAAFFTLLDELEIVPSS